jgi:hypothetical protein
MTASTTHKIFGCVRDGGRATVARATSVEFYSFVVLEEGSPATRFLG